MVKTHQFFGNLIANSVACSKKLFSICFHKKITWNHKQLQKNITFWKNIKRKILNFIFQKFKKLSTLCCGLSLCKWNKIINFVLSVKLSEKIHFPQGLLKTYIFYPNRFLYVLWKKSRNKLCVRPHDTYDLFRMFFSRVNNKQFFLQVDDPIRAKGINYNES